MKTQEKISFSITTGTIIKFIAIVAFFYLAYQLIDVLMIVLAAIVLASAVEPGIKWFEERRIPRIIGALVIYIFSALMLVAVFYFVLVPLVGESVKFLHSMPDYSDSLAQSDGLGFGEFSAQGLIGTISDSLSLGELAENISSVLTNFSKGFMNTVQVVFGGVLSFILIVVLSFYLAVQKDGVGNFLRIVTPLQYEDYVVGLWRRSRKKIGLWMQGQLLLGVIVGVLVYLGLTLLRVENALLLAFLAAVLEIIPLFGPVLAAVPAVLFAFADGGLTLGLVVVGLYVIIQQFESQLIYPLVVKKVIGVPPIISILAIVVGAKLAGFMGIILSVPIATVLIELLDDMERKKLATRKE